MYSKAQLNSKTINHKEVFSRYLHKYYFHRDEFNHLKIYEKDYVFRCMEVIYNDRDMRCHTFDLYRVIEAREFIFYSIILTYGEDVETFKPPIYGIYGKISANQIRKDLKFFNNYLNIWKTQISLHKGRYLEVLYPMVNKKLKELRNHWETKDYKKRERYCYAVFFYIYYKARLYFDDIDKRCISFIVNRYVFIINIYTFCHIFQRHYVPSLNRRLNITMNAQNDCIDINDLPMSIKKLVCAYFEVCGELSSAKEYLLFKFGNTPYIIWIKFKPLKELNSERGFEVRSYYKCEEVRDLKKFDGTMDVTISENLVCCIPVNN